MEYTLTDKQIEEFNALYGEACELFKGLILLDGNPTPKIGFFEKRKLNKSISMFERALKIHPASWQSMFFIAKAHQSLGELPKALEWFKNAYEYEPENISLAKEIGLCAGQLGDHETAIFYMESVAKVYPEEYSLQVNLGLSYLMSNQLNLAKAQFSRAVLAEPGNINNKKLLELTNKVISGEVPCPKSEKEIIKFI